MGLDSFCQAPAMTTSRLVVNAARRVPRRPLTSLAYRYVRWLGTGRRHRQVGSLASGATIELDLRDWMHRELFFRGTIEEETTALFCQQLRPGGTFFDVGANEGYYALLAMDLGAARAVAFEPQTALAALLRASVRRNQYPVTIVEAACAATSGPIMFYDSDQSDNTGAASAVSGLHSAGKHEVQAVALDDYCEQQQIYPNAVKIDVEGYELEVLKGFQRTLGLHPPDLILAELTDDPRHPDHREVAPFLTRFGYTAHRIEAGGRLAPFDTPRGLENVAFIR